MRCILAVLLLTIATTAAAQEGEEDAAHRADRLRTQQLNRNAAAAVARRDRAQGAYRQDGDGRDVYRQNAYRQDAYRAERAQYEREMARWRRRVEACRAGYYDACDDR